MYINAPAFFTQSIQRKFIGDDGNEIDGILP